MLKDNFDFADEHDAEEARWLATRPVCAKCGEPIQDEYAYDIDGDLLCRECAEEWLKEQRKDVESMIEEGW